MLDSIFESSSLQAIIASLWVVNDNETSSFAFGDRELNCSLQSRICSEPRNTWDVWGQQFVKWVICHWKAYLHVTERGKITKFKLIKICIYIFDSD